MGREYQFSDVVSSIYETIYFPETWQACLEKITAFVGGDKALVLLIGENQGTAIACSINHSSDVAALYANHYGAQDPRRELASFLPVGEAHHVQKMLANETFNQSDYFQDIHVAGDILDSVHGIINRVPGFAQSSISIQRSFKKGFFEKEHERRMQLLMPHLVNAVSLAADLSAQTLIQSSSQNAGNKLFFLVNTDLRFVPLQEGWEELLAQIDGLRIQNGCLLAESGLEDRLKKVVSRAISIGIGERFLYPLANTEYCEVQVSPFPEELANFQFIGMRGQYALLTIDLHRKPSQRGVQIFASSFGLTQKESDLLAEFSRKSILREAAVNVGIAYETARWHMKTILHKTNSLNQADLLARLARADFMKL